MPTISVVMTTYNGAPYVREQVLSIVNQSHPADEIIISDDASTDDTVNILRSFMPKVSVIENAANVGLMRNIESALRRVTSDVVVLSDQDDVWHPNKLDSISAAFRRGDIKMWVSDALLVDASGSMTGRRLWQYTRPFPTLHSGVLKGKALKLAIQGRTLTGATMAVHRDIVEHALPFPPSILDPGGLYLHDGWLAAIAAVFGEVQFEPDAMTHYRQHPNQMIGVAADAIRGAPGHRFRVARRKPELRQEFQQVSLIVERVRALAANGRAVPVSGDEVFRLARLAEVRAEARSVGHTFHVAREVIRGDYGRFTRGIMSAIKDIIT